MRKYVGFAAIYGWCGVVAYSMVITGNISHRLSPFLVCFLTFSLVAVFFIIYNARRLRHFIGQKMPWDDKVNLAGLNLSSFISWALMIYPLAYLDPTIVATIILGINPIATAIIGRVFLKQRPPIQLVLISLGLAFVMLLLIQHTLDEYRANSLPEMNIGLSLAACVLSGLGTCCNNLFTKKLMGSGFSIPDLMCSRFFLTIVLSGLIALQSGPLDLNTEMIGPILLTTIFLVIIPLLLLQISLRILDPLRVSIVSPFMPVLVVGIQYLSQPGSLSLWVVASTVLTWALVTGGTYISIKNSRN